MADITKIEEAFKRTAQWITEGSDASRAGRFVPKLAKKTKATKRKKKTVFHTENL